VAKNLKERMWELEKNLISSIEFHLGYHPAYAQLMVARAENLRNLEQIGEAVEELLLQFEEKLDKLIDLDQISWKAQEMALLLTTRAINLGTLSKIELKRQSDAAAAKPLRGITRDPDH